MPPLSFLKKLSVCLIASFAFFTVDSVDAQILFRRCCPTINTCPPQDCCQTQCWRGRGWRFNRLFRRSCCVEMCNPCEPIDICGSATCTANYESGVWHVYNNNCVDGCACPVPPPNQQSLRCVSNAATTIESADKICDGNSFMT